MTKTCCGKRRDIFLKIEPVVPTNPNLAPPGWYLLFLCDEDGIPSIGEWIRPDRKPAEKPVAPRVSVTEPQLHAHDHNPGFPIPGFPRKSDHRTDAD